LLACPVCDDFEPLKQIPTQERREDEIGRGWPSDLNFAVYQLPIAVVMVEGRGGLLDVVDRHATHAMC
jgi:hypothetical protein